MDLGLHLKKFKSLTQECFVPSLKLIKLFWRRSHKCKMSTDELMDRKMDAGQNKTKIACYKSFQLTGT